MAFRRKEPRRARAGVVLPVRLRVAPVLTAGVDEKARQG